MTDITVVKRRIDELSDRLHTWQQPSDDDPGTGVCGWCGYSYRDHEDESLACPRSHQENLRSYDEMEGLVAGLRAARKTRRG